MNKNLFVLVFLIASKSSQSFFLLPNQILENGESFIKDEIEFMFLNVAVNWEEAQVICSSYENGSLVIIPNESIRDFLGLALSEISFDAEQFWVGARMLYDITQGFQWINGIPPYIPDKYFIRRGKENIQVNRTCLALSRQFHDIAHFINLECQLKRAVICQKPFEKAIDGCQTTPNWIVVNNKEYGIFYDKKTWYESIRECNNKHDAHLASFEDIEEVHMIGRFLLIGRPSLERAWIGGEYQKKGWVFVSEGIEILERTNPITAFPPWRFNRTIRLNGCLLIDRHLNKTPVFVESRCTQRRSYICLRSKDRTPEKSVITINQITYIFFFTKKTWDDAFETCNEINATFIKITTDILHDVTYMMGENATEVQHLWIGGRLSVNGEYFYWVADKEIIPMQNTDIDRFPPWLSNDTDLNYPCLNLDRENHNRPIFYGAYCNYPQEFICVQK